MFFDFYDYLASYHETSVQDYNLNFIDIIREFDALFWNNF